MDKKQKRQWKDIPQARRTRIAVMAIAEMIFTSLALWDLSHRPADQVRGKKLLWGIFAFVQPVGPISYLLFGRKKHAEPA